MDRGVLARWTAACSVGYSASGMGLEFKLTDRELPASPAFIHFLARKLGRGRPAQSEGWVDQRSERLLALAEEDSQAEAAAAADAVMAEPAGRERVARAYGLLCAFIIGDTAHLTDLRSRFHFVNVIGIPRTGGTYLTAEIYRALATIKEIEDALIVSLDLPGGTFFMPLFVKLADELVLDAALEQQITDQLRREYTPRHVPDRIVQVPAIPVTLTGKKMEVPVRRILLGTPADEAANRNAMADPDALDFYVSYAATQRDYPAG